MPTVLNVDIAQALGQSFIDDVFNQRSRYYYTLGRSYSWVDDKTPDDVVDSEKYKRDVRKDILFAKQITGSSVSFIVPRIDYQPNVIYDKFDDGINLTNKKFYVLSSDFNVYKCLDNNISRQSTVEPFGVSPTPISLSDGYVWQYIYTIPPSLRTKFLTRNFMSVYNAITEKYYTRGKISSIKINSGGFGYNESTDIVVSGDGYLENNPVAIQDFIIGSSGAGYTSQPTAETTDQFGNSISFDANLNLIIGQRVKVSDVAGVRFYEATNSGQLSTVAPTHYYSTETNGTVQLKHIGTKPRVTVGFSASSVGKVIVTDGGFGYTFNPEATKDSPGTGCLLTTELIGDAVSSIEVNETGSGYTSEDITIQSPYPTAVIFPTNTLVSLGDIYYVDLIGGRYYYRVDVAGTTSANEPTHDTGTQLNGTAVLTVVAKNATARAILGTINSVTKFFDVLEANVLSGGSGYVQSTTTVTFTGGNPIVPATGTVSVIGGKVVSVNVTFPGYGYQTAPTIQISGDGIGANVVPVIQCGYGYSSPPNIIVSNPNNVDGELPVIFSTVQKTKAKLKPVIINGILRGVDIIDGGIGYTFADIEVLGAGTGASITPIFASSELNTIQAQSELLATAGTLSSVTVDNAGANITSISIELRGDGTGASITPIIDNGRLINVIVNNAGQDYTFLDIIITVNSNAIPPVARAILAPLNGHGSNPIKELNAHAVAVSASIAKEDNNGFPVDNEFRQVSIIKSLLENNGTKLLEQSSASGCFAVSTILTSIPIAKNSILTGENNSQYRVIDFTSDKILLSAITSGDIVAGDILKLTLNNVEYNITVNGVDSPEFDKNSGELLYIENTRPFIPSIDQTVNITTTINLI